MLSYWATQQASTGDSIVPAAKFIHYMDGRLQELSQIRLGFDATRITDLGDQMDNSVALVKSQLNLTYKSKLI
jgi:hypothetical protein